MPEPWNNPRRVQSSIVVTFGDVWECVTSQYEKLVDLRSGDFSMLLSATEIRDLEDDKENDYDDRDEDFDDDGEDFDDENVSF